MIASLTSTMQAPSLKNKIRLKISWYLRISVIVEKDVLCVVVSLIDQHQLGDLVAEFVILPVVIVVLNGHRAELFQVL